jgi:hypothetical protein
MYKIIGADQKEYGPITADQVRQWIAENRANGLTLARFEEGAWKPLSTFAEFASVLPSSVPPPIGSVNPVYSSSSTGPKTSGLIVGGFICSALGIVCCGPVVSTIGLVLSIIGLTQVNKDPQRYSGKGLAIAGIVLALLGYGIFITLLFSGALEHLTKNIPGWPH